MTIQRVMMFAGLALLVAVLGLLAWRRLPTPSPQTDAERRVNAALGALERLCLSNISTASKSAVIAGLKTGIGGIGADASAEKVASVVRGAAADLPAAEKTSEGIAIRTCLAQNFDKVLAALGPPTTAITPPSRQQLGYIYYGRKPNGEPSDNGMLRPAGIDPLPMFDAIDPGDVFVGVTDTQLHQLPKRTSLNLVTAPSGSCFTVIKRGDPIDPVADAPGLSGGWLYVRTNDCR